MRKIRYYPLRRRLKEKGISLDAMRAQLGLLPSEIVKIETERQVSPITLHLLCRYFGCDVTDLMDVFEEEETNIFYSRRILDAHSYRPKHYVKKEFKTKFQ